ncbi:MAG: hypothetical protein K2Z81_27855 [Cyanobacteria bacterium]|nr:hypothetical protein [Cyanobacteriota bacterium]
MQFAKRVTSTRFRLGEILLDAGIISPEVLNQTLLIARRAAMPIGRVLVMSGHVTDLDINIAVETQSSIRNGSIDVKIAFELLRFAHKQQISIDEAYRRHGIGRDLGTLPRIGKLLLAANLIDQIGMRCALKHSESTGFPLGNSLVSLNLVAEPILLCCMNLQILIRDKYLSFLDAVRCLKIIVSEQVTLEVALKTIGVPFYNSSPVPRMGDLLVASGLMLHADRMILLEMAAECDKPLGELLKEYNMVSPAVLDAVIKVQAMFNDGNPVFTRSRAIRLLQLVQSMDTSLEVILAEFDILDQVVTLLRVAGVVPDSLISHTKSSIRDHEQSVSEALITRGIINKDLSQAGLECLHKIQTGETTYEKALAYLVQYNNWLLNGNRPKDKPNGQTLAKLIELRTLPKKSSEQAKKQSQQGQVKSATHVQAKPAPSAPAKPVEPEQAKQPVQARPAAAAPGVQVTSIGIIKPSTPLPISTPEAEKARFARQTSSQAIIHDSDVNVYTTPPPIAVDELENGDVDFAPPPISWESHKHSWESSRLSWEFPQEEKAQQQKAPPNPNDQYSTFSPPRPEPKVRIAAPPPPPPKPRSPHADYERWSSKNAAPKADGSEPGTNACGVRVPPPPVPRQAAVVAGTMRIEASLANNERHEDDNTDPNLDVA